MPFIVTGSNLDWSYESHWYATAAEVTAFISKGWLSDIRVGHVSEWPTTVTDQFAAEIAALNDDDDEEDN